MNGTRQTERHIHRRQHLTSFFTVCQNDDFAPTLLYADMPRYGMHHRNRLTVENIEHQLKAIQMYLNQTL